MQEMPKYADKFASFHVHEAIYRTEQREETILLEFRGTALEKELLFTVVDNNPIHVGSIHELVHALPSLVSLSLQHRGVRLLWNGIIKEANLVEMFRPSQSSLHPSTASVQLSLTVDNKTYETTICDTLQDAIWELEEMAEAEWWLCTCYDCHYSGYARFYILSDRKYWCYRDVPEALEEIQAKGKGASSEALFAGNYFVDAFHTCAAWRPLQRASLTGEISSSI